MLMRAVQDTDEMALQEQQEQANPLPGEDGAAEDVVDARPSASDADEQADGIIEDSPAEDADAESAADDAQAAEITVDLRTLEALLLSTHSPLTAGRLGELLDLPTTKPVRKA